MSVTPSYLTYVLDQLTPLGPVVAKRMFGGIGLYHDQRIFGLIDDDVVYLRVDDTSRPQYEQRGMSPFQPVKSKPKMISLNYYQLPNEILEDTEELRSWARYATTITTTAATRRKPKRAAKRAKAAAPKKTAPKRKVAKPTTKPKAKPGALTKSAKQKTAPKKTAKKKR